jgi:Amidase
LTKLFQERSNFMTIMPGIKTPWDRFMAYQYLSKIPTELKELRRRLDIFAWLGTKHTKESESHVVTMLRDAGAVFYVKTTVPNTGLMVRELAFSEIEDTIADGLVEW